MSLCLSWILVLSCVFFNIFGFAFVPCFVVWFLISLCLFLVLVLSCGS